MILALMLALNFSFAQGIMSPERSRELAICPFCGPQYNWSQYPVMTPYMPFQQYAPWWVMYGSLSYPNFYYPGAWNMNGGGINGGMYPGQGNVFMAKPNLYFYSKKETKLSVKIEPEKDTSWLLAIPPHEKKGWEFTTQGPAKLKTKDVAYDYLFYDLRGSDASFQDQQGYCVNPEELIPKLVNDLTNAGFRKSAIEDFVDHWNYKIASSERYCVYPQTHHEMNPHFKITASKQPKEITRLWFIVVPEEFRKKSVSGRFGKPPTGEWASPYLKKKRDVASSGELEAFEWAVGFLAANVASPSKNPTK